MKRLVGIVLLTGLMITTARGQIGPAAQANEQGWLTLVYGDVANVQAQWDQTLYDQLRQEYIDQGVDTMTAGMGAYYMTTQAGRTRFLRALETIRNNDPVVFDLAMQAFAVRVVPGQ